MDIAHRIAYLGDFLRQTAGVTTSDLNEQGLMAHRALVHILSTDPSLSGWPPPAARGSWQASRPRPSPRRQTADMNTEARAQGWPPVEPLDAHRLALRSGEARPL
jgi:hypothetical protein